MDYIAHFRDGSTSPITDVRHSGAFLTGLAHRHDGYARCLFFDQHGRLHQPDAWVSRISAAEAVRAYRAPQLVHAQPTESVVA